MDWKAIANELGIELDEDGKATTFEDWVRMGQYAFSDDPDIQIVVLSPDRPDELCDMLGV